MNDFLKPNRTKVIIFSTIILLSIVIFVRSVMLGFAAMGNDLEGFGYKYGTWDYVSISLTVILLWPALIGVYFPVPLIGAILNLLSIPFALIYWYLLSCLIFKVSSSIRK